MGHRLRAAGELEACRQGVVHRRGAGDVGEERVDRAGAQRGKKWAWRARGWRSLEEARDAADAPQDQQCRRS